MMVPDARGYPAMRIDTVGLRAQGDHTHPHRMNPGRRSRDRSRRFAPGLDASLESRSLLSAAATGSRSAIALSAFNPEVSLPHQEAGTTFDMLVPGARLGSTHEITVGPDGNLWFTQQLQDRVGPIDPRRPVHLVPDRGEQRSPRHPVRQAGPTLDHPTVFEHH